MQVLYTKNACKNHLATDHQGNASVKIISTILQYRNIVSAILSYPY